MSDAHLTAALEMLDAMEAAKSRLKTSLKYGPDMKSSADLCITDAIKLLEQAIAKVEVDA